MPFEEKIHTSHGDIAIWDLDDSVEELQQQSSLSDFEQQRFETFTAERRKKEFLATRILLHSLLENKDEIVYPDSTGRPFLKNSKKNISISHSLDFAVVIVSDKKIGIDIEQTNRNIDRVAKRFLHPSEQEFISKQENQQNAKILFWSAKEAIFKCSEFQGIEFNEQIIIHPFNLNKTEGEFKASLLYNKQKINYLLKYRFFKNNIMVYCIEEY